jgi:hypothetical protein
MKVVVVTQYKIIFQDLSVWTKENHEELQAG